MRAFVVARWPRILIAAFLPILVLIAMAGEIASAPSPTPATNDSDQLRVAITDALPGESGRSVPRLSSVRIDPTGDATIVFALRAGDTPQEIIAGGSSDMLSIFRAVYHPALVASVRTTTVIGTFPVAGQYGVREWPVLRAALSRQTANRLDWDHLTATRLPEAVDIWWVYPPLLTAIPVASPQAATPTATPRT